MFQKKIFFFKLKIIVGFDLWAQKPTQDFCFPFIFRIGSPPYICYILLLLRGRIVTKIHQYLLTYKYFHYAESVLKE